ncbi:AraC family transcriptional regulator [Arenibaculum sp.]|jgi:AraC-like DNA-binding protein|uniref:helix-turn-helix transcriptional regulator n=1 Tax=Arenibaculum sp. TaxID=2865862 RepID=UPI002E128CAF|nr:AraC family transcriptional regulator [Arenibaculum sp.]
MAARLDARGLEAFRRTLSGLGPSTGSGGAGPALTTFFARRQERVAAFVMPSAALVVPVEGEKQLHVGGAVHRFRPGELLVLRAGWRGDVVNEPDAEAGCYRALLLTFPSELVLRARRAHPNRPACELRGGYFARLALTDVLASTLLHVAAGIAGGAGLPGHVVEHRVMEVLLLLADGGVLPLAPAAQGDSAADAVRMAVGAKPDHPWTAALLARDLGTSEATLRRRLAREGTSLRVLLQQERMAAAESLLKRERVSVSEAAAACGYASRARFAKRFQAVRGVTPSALAATLPGGD